MKTIFGLLVIKSLVTPLITNVTIQQITLVGLTCSNRDYDNYTKRLKKTEVYLPCEPLCPSAGCFVDCLVDRSVNLLKLLKPFTKHDFSAFENLVIPFEARTIFL